MTEKPVIIFVPGLFGSSLQSQHSRCSCFKIKWLTSCTVINSCFCCCNRGHQVKLPINWTNGVQDRDDLTVNGPVHLAYSKWLEWASSNSNIFDFHSFAWDWRRDLAETEALFRKFVENVCISKDGKISPAVLVTHSTGSIIAWPFINARPDLFRSWVTVGGAIGPGVKALHDLTDGWLIGGCIRLLSAGTVFTHATIYVFFNTTPDESGNENFTGLVDAETKEDIKFDIHDANEWKTRKLGPYRYRQNITDTEHIHLQNCLDRGKAYREQHLVGCKLIHPVDSYKHLSIICYGSDTHPTDYKYKWSLEKGAHLQESPIESKPGDGTILYENWTRIPCGLPFKVVKTLSRHGSLCDDNSLHELVRGLLIPENLNETDRMHRM